MFILGSTNELVSLKMRVNKVFVELHYVVYLMSYTMLFTCNILLVLLYFCTF